MENLEKTVIQWYEKFPELYQKEINSMELVCPKASHGFFITGQMYWKIPCVPFINGERKKWILLILYDSNYPHRGQSVKCYPIKPDYDAIRRIVLESNVNPKIVPHCILDGNGMMYFSSDRIGDMCITRSATSELRRAYRWVTCFELGIQNQNVWDMWCGNLPRQSINYI